MNKLKQTYGVYNREMQRVFKIPTSTIFVPLFTTLLYLVIFGLVIGPSIDISTDIPYFHFMFSGLMGLSMIRYSYENTAFSFIFSKFVDELQEFKIIPLSLYQISWAVSLAAMTRGMIDTLLVLIGCNLVGLFSGYAIVFPKHPLLFIYFLIITGLTFGNLGASVALRAKDYEFIAGVNNFFLLPMTYLGTSFFPLTLLPPIAQNIALFNPIFYFISGIRYALFNAYTIPLPSIFLITLLIFVVSHILFLWQLNDCKNFFK